MALIDVSEILSDPDMCDVITLYRRTQTVDSHGRASVSETSKTILAVVTQAGGDELQRLPEGATIAGTINVHTQEPLIAADGNVDADDILYKGRRYTVTLLSDYSNFGAGFSFATCTVKAVSP